MERRHGPVQGAKIVTYHRSWPNFVEAYGLNVVGYVEPKPGIPPSPSHTFELGQEMKKDGVKIIIIEPYFDSKTPNAIGRDTGAQVVTLAPSVGGAKGSRHRLHPAVRLRRQDAGRGIQDGRGQVAVSWDILQFLLAPFVASLVIAGIHAYLGIHVVERGVIFVDLSLAQIAAFGATMAHPAALVGRRSALDRPSTGPASPSRSSAPPSFPRFAAATRGSRRKRSSASRTRSPPRRRFWR